MPDRPVTITTPRWVKVFGILALAVVLLFLTLLFTRGQHGPGRHLRSGNPASGTSPVHRP